MKICFFATNPYAVNAFLQLHILNLSKNNNVTLVTNLNSCDIGFEFGDNNKIDLPIKRKLSPISDVLIFLKLVKLFRYNNFDVVHTITPKAGFLGMLASWVCNVPYRFHTFTGQHWIRKIGILRFLYKCVDKLIFITASSVFVDGHNQIAKLEKELLIDKGRIELLGPGSISGVNLSRFNPSTPTRINFRKELNTPMSSFIFLFVGRLCVDKGVHDIFFALKNFQGLNKLVEVWFVGPDEELVENSLDFKSIPNEIIIRFFGECNNPEIFMQSADALLLPSYREGFGSVLIEANACGLPVICYDIYGVRDAIKSGVNGILVETGSIEALSEKMVYMVENKSEAYEMGKRGFEISKQFDSKIVASAWLDFYDRIKLK